jgi:circadian clock protein KaiC
MADTIASDAARTARGISKCPTGIQGLDEILFGGLPAGRPTLVTGAAGCGKTLFSMEFLVRGATQFGEPGVFMAFEETGPELAANVRSLGFDLDDLERQGKLSVDHVRVERAEIEETGEYDLEGLFVRLGLAIDSIGAKRVVLDTIESLFSGLNNTAILRGELRRLFRWLKDKGVTAVITGECGPTGLTRQGLEEYVSDCVIVLDHRVDQEMSTRRLRVVKYRGSVHGTNEYPFLIDADGISVLPITSLGLAHEVCTERVSSGVPGLDAMLDGGYYRGTSILASGTAGTGNTSLAAHFAHAACARGERCVYFLFEESPGQLIRNMTSIGLDLGQWRKAGLLEFQAARPNYYGLEMHLATIHRVIERIAPQVVIVDPVSTMLSIGRELEVRAMLTRLVDYLKSRQITALFTSLTNSGPDLESTEVGVSSIMDTWLLLRDQELGGERNRLMYILKSRGMAHSNQLREFLLTRQGIELATPYLGPEGVLTGSARVAQAARERAGEVERQQALQRGRRMLAQKQEEMESQLGVLRAQFEAELEQLQANLDRLEAGERQWASDRTEMAKSRRADGRLPSGQEGSGR